MRTNLEMLTDFIERQLAIWNLAADNYNALGHTCRRSFMLGDMPVYLQHNPARIKSTAAATDSKSIKERPCFLCKENRPKEQLSFEEMLHTEDTIPGWETLVNPYPIFPIHLTIPSISHTPQNEIPFEMAAFAERWPGMAIFFNGAKSGASAPDHAHMQAVLASELPIIHLCEKYHPVTNAGIMSCEDFNADLPFLFYSAVIYPDAAGMQTLSAMQQFSGTDANGNPDPGLVNCFMWISGNGVLRAALIPRSAHRPSCFYAEGNERKMISPGAIDMAGVIIAPRKEDFDSITEDDIRKIYAETGLNIS